MPQYLVAVGTTLHNRMSVLLTFYCHKGLQPLTTDATTWPRLIQTGNEIKTALLNCYFRLSSIICEQNPMAHFISARLYNQRTQIDGKRAANEDLACIGCATHIMTTHQNDILQTTKTARSSNRETACREGYNASRHRACIVRASKWRRLKEMKASWKEGKRFTTVQL